VFDSADVDRVGELDELEVVRLMKKLNNSLATIKIQQKLKVSLKKLKVLSTLSLISLFISLVLSDGVPCAVWELPRQQPNHCSGLATLPSVGAVP